jgi:hypothetical protein
MIEDESIRKKRRVRFDNDLVDGDVDVSEVLPVNMPSSSDQVNETSYKPCILICRYVLERNT